jgi:hypothetical protein
MNRRQGIIMPQDVMFGVTMITKGKFFSGSDCRERQMYVFLILLCFNRMATGTIHIDKTLSEVKERIGIRVAVYTGQFAQVVDILGPLFRINVQCPQIPIMHNLRDFRFAVTCQTILIREGRGLGICKRKRE